MCWKMMMLWLMMIMLIMTSERLYMTISHTYDTYDYFNFTKSMALSLHFWHLGELGLCWAGTRDMDFGLLK